MSIDGGEQAMAQEEAHRTPGDAQQKPRIDERGMIQDDGASDYMTEDAPAFADDVIKALATPVDPALVEEKPPNGILFVPWIQYQKVLVAAFGVGGFRMVPHPKSPPRVVDGKTMTWRGALFVRPPGTSRFIFVKEATGGCGLHGGMSPADATEGAESDAFTKCCKRLNIFSELFDPAWRRWWTSEYKGKHQADVRNPKRPETQSLMGTSTNGPAVAAAVAAETTTAPPPTGSMSVADTGEAAPEETYQAIQAEMKRLHFKAPIAKEFLARYGATKVSGLSAVQAVEALAILKAEAA